MCNISIETYVNITARCYGGTIAQGLYKYWEVINREFYNGTLPPPLITFEVMAYGSCVGLTYPDHGHIRLKKPLGKITSGIDAETISTLLHEAIHYAQPYTCPEIPHHKGADKTSHNNDYWITEINRVHKKITGGDLGADVQIMKREGKGVRRVNLGKLTRLEVATYPKSVSGLSEVIFSYLSKRVNKVK